MSTVSLIPHIGDDGAPSSARAVGSPALAPAGSLGGPVDDRLLRKLEPAAGEALVQAARLLHCTFTLDRWLVNGRSRAPVALVIEHDARVGRSRRLVLKVPAVDEGNPPGEDVRHRSAYDDAPDAFARAHLTAPAREPIHVDEGRWITFQGVAGDDVESVGVMTDVLNVMLGAGDAVAGARPCDSRLFARCCGSVVRAVLGQWNGAPRVARFPSTVAEFLRSHLHDQLERGGRLHRASLIHCGDTVELPGEPAALPNPFALARGRLLDDTRTVKALIGKTHGDLHTDNILIRTRPSISPRDFRLVDFALYEPGGPMTRDPIHLLLYILARRLDHLSPPQRTALISVLVDPFDASRALLPGWLLSVIDAMEDAAAAWLAGSGLQPEWRRQRLLSLAGCGLLFIGRTSTRHDDQAWFLRLAAHATAAFLA